MSRLRSLTTITHHQKSHTTSIHFPSSWALPVIVQGLRRSWSYRCRRNHYTAVGVSPDPTLESACNGVLIPLVDPARDLAALDEREKDYVRVKLDPRNVAVTLPWTKGGRRRRRSEEEELEGGCDRAPLSAFVDLEDAVIW
ncbi:hypothetical protein HK101_007120, partial [Irineochytrium annulatum]